MTDVLASSYSAAPLIRRRSGLRDWTDTFVFFALLILSAQGFLNYAFRGTPLDVWKQMLLGLLFLMALIRLRKSQLLIFSLVMGAATVLIVASLIQGVLMVRIGYNIFYYIAWLPFYVFGGTQNAASQRRKIVVLAFGTISVSAIGLALQLYTPYLDALNDNLESTQYAASVNEAQRLAFVFVASTIVVPTLGGFFRLLCMTTRSTLIKLTSLFALIWCAIATGARGSFIMLAGVILMAQVRMSRLGRIAAIGGVLLVGSFVFSSPDSIVGPQLYRVLHNDATADSNQDRLSLWRYAIGVIQTYNVDQHIVGSGIGVTNDTYPDNVAWFHGESSFFQAYIECGIIGLLLRLAPFFLLLRGSRDRPTLIENMIYGSALFVSCAVAPVFGAYGIQCILGYSAGLSSRKDETV